MLWQMGLTVLIVAGSSAYALWSLLPAGLRRGWRARLRGQPVPPPTGACGGCDHCGSDAGSAAPSRQAGQAPKETVIQFVRRPRAAASPPAAANPGASADASANPRAPS